MPSMTVPLFGPSTIVTSMVFGDFDGSSFCVPTWITSSPFLTVCLSPSKVRMNPFSSPAGSSFPPASLQRLVRPCSFIHVAFASSRSGRLLLLGLLLAILFVLALRPPAIREICFADIEVGATVRAILHGPSLGCRKGSRLATFVAGRLYLHALPAGAFGFQGLMRTDNYNRLLGVGAADIDAGVEDS